MNTKLHAICDSQRRPLNPFVTAGQVSDYLGARALLSSVPDVDCLLGDRGYDADWFREALQDKGIRACIPGRKQRTKPVRYDKQRYKRRNRIEIMFGNEPQEHHGPIDGTTMDANIGTGIAGHAVPIACLLAFFKPDIRLKPSDVRKVGKEDIAHPGFEPFMYLQHK